MNESEISQRVKEGWLRIKFIVEIAGFPEEHVSNALKLVKEDLEKKKKLKIIKNELKDAEKINPEAKFFSGFIETETLIESFSELMGLIFDYLPSSVEIIEPDEIKDSSTNMIDLLNDLIAKLHNYDSTVKTLRAQKAVLEKELEKLKS